MPRAVGGELEVIRRIRGRTIKVLSCYWCLVVCRAKFWLLIDLCTCDYLNDKGEIVWFGAIDSSSPSVRVDMFTIELLFFPESI